MPLDQSSVEPVRHGRIGSTVQTRNDAFRHIACVRRHSQPIGAVGRRSHQLGGEGRNSSLCARRHTRDRVGNVDTPSRGTADEQECVSVYGHRLG